MCIRDSGGSIKGKAIIASNITLNLNFVCDNHQASGVPITIKMAVLKKANFMVTIIAERSNSLNIMVNHSHFF